MSRIRSSTQYILSSDKNTRSQRLHNARGMRASLHYWLASLCGHSYNTWKEPQKQFTPSWYRYVYLVSALFTNVRLIVPRKKNALRQLRFIPVPKTNPLFKHANVLNKTPYARLRNRKSYKSQKSHLNCLLELHMRSPSAYFLC